MSEEKSTSWSEQNFNGFNPQLLSIAEKLAQLARLGMETKLAQLKEELRREGEKHDHPIMREFIASIEKLEIK